MRTAIASVPWAMLALFALFGTLPAWIGAIGLYPYLGVEVMVVPRSIALEQCADQRAEARGFAA